MPSWFSPACESQWYTSFSHFIFNDVMLAVWNQQWWECLHYGTCKALQIRAFLPRWSIFKIYLHTTVHLPFYKNHSCWDHWWINLPHTIGISVYFLFDFSVTSDTIDHFFLIEMVYLIWLQDSSLSWFSSLFAKCSVLVPWPIFFLSLQSLNVGYFKAQSRTLLSSIYTHSLGGLTYDHVFKYPP